MSHRVPSAIAILLGMTFGVRATHASSDVDAVARWEQIIDAQRVERSFIETIQYRYTFSYRAGTETNPEMDATIHASYAAEGSKVFNAFQITHSPTTGAGLRARGMAVVEGIPIDSEMTYDGVLGRMRGMGNKNLVTQTRNRDLLRSPGKQPWDAIEIKSSDKLKEYIEQGQFELQSLANLDVDGHAVVKATFSYVGSGAKWLEIWYDGGRGYIPIASKQYMEDGRLVREVRDVVIAEFAADGNHFYFPVGAIAESYRDGVSIYKETMDVDEKAVIINQDVPDEQFVMVLGPEERVYDADLQTLLVDAEPMGVDLDRLPIAKADDGLPLPEARLTRLPDSAVQVEVPDSITGVVSSSRASDTNRWTSNLWGVLAAAVLGLAVAGLFLYRQVRGRKGVGSRIIE